MSRVIATAGRATSAKPETARREVIAKIRAKLRDAKASDAEVDDALEALVELTKE